MGIDKSSGDFMKRDSSIFTLCPFDATGKRFASLVKCADAVDKALGNYGKRAYRDVI